jgi:hypothetical protein
MISPGTTTGRGTHTIPPSQPTDTGEQHTSVSPQQTAADHNMPEGHSPHQLCGVCTQTCIHAVNNNTNLLSCTTTAESQAQPVTGAAAATLHLCPAHAGQVGCSPARWAGPASEGHASNQCCCCNMVVAPAPVDTAQALCLVWHTHSPSRQVLHSTPVNQPAPVKNAHS